MKNHQAGIRDFRFGRPSLEACYTRAQLRQRVSGEQFLNGLGGGRRPVMEHPAERLSAVPIRIWFDVRPDQVCLAAVFTPEKDHSGRVAVARRAAIIGRR
jgi:hypothetical protein